MNLMGHKHSCRAPVELNRVTGFVLNCALKYNSVLFRKPVNRGHGSFYRCGITRVVRLARGIPLIKSGIERFEKNLVTRSAQETYQKFWIVSRSSVFNFLWSHNNGARNRRISLY